jgi:hypothetical protein
VARSVTHAGEIPRISSRWTNISRSLRLSSHYTVLWMKGSIVFFKLPPLPRKNEKNHVFNPHRTMTRTIH